MKNNKLGKIEKNEKELTKKPELKINENYITKSSLNSTTVDNYTRKVFEGLNGSIRDIFDLLLRKERYSNFIDFSIRDQIDTIINESKELKESYLCKDMEGVKKELSDTIYVLLMTITKLYKENIIDDEYLKNLGKEQKEKIFGRSPFLKEQYKPTLKKEEQLWQETKIKKEKN